MQVFTVTEYRSQPIISPMNKTLKLFGALALAALGGVAVAAWVRRRRSEVPAERVAALPPCILCNEESGNKEHFWPAWIHRYIKENKIELGGLRVQRGNEPETITDDLEGRSTRSAIPATTHG